MDTSHIELDIFIGRQSKRPYELKSQLSNHSWTTRVELIQAFQWNWNGTDNSSKSKILGGTKTIYITAVARWTILRNYQRRETGNETTPKDRPKIQITTPTSVSLPSLYKRLLSPSTLDGFHSPPPSLHQ
jgi:hypothetical protein